MKEKAAAIRAAIKGAGFPARVRITPGGGGSVQVFVPRYEARFNGQEIQFFCEKAKELGLTMARGLPIMPAHQSQLIGRTCWEFWAP